MTRNHLVVIVLAIAVATGCRGGKSDDRHADVGVSADASREPGSGSYKTGALTPAERTSGMFRTKAEPTPAAHGATPAPHSAPAAAEQEFVRTVAMSNQMEIDLGRLAEQQASRDEVRQLGKRIADDHESAQRDLQMIGATPAGDAARLGAETSGAMPPENQAIRSKLESLKGADFDRAFADEMVKGHEKAIGEFERAASSMSGQVRAFAEKQLPALREHLRLAQQLQQRQAPR